ncbi:IgG receptor FcRn large subunit p51-like [Mantella aurantiaca]
MITNKVVTENKASTMTCTATEFYPPDIRITWLRDNQLLENSELGEITLNEDRTFSVKSIVTITPSSGDHGKIFSCKVQHASLPEPRKEDFQLDIKGESNTVVIVGVIVGLFCLILTIVVGILVYKRCRSAPQPQTVEVEHPESKEAYQLCPAEDLLHPSTQDEYKVDCENQHPSPQEADVGEEPNGIGPDGGPPTDSCSPTEDFSAEELDNFEIIHFSELPRYP